MDAAVTVFSGADLSLPSSSSRSQVTNNAANARTRMAPSRIRPIPSVPWVVSAVSSSGFSWAASRLSRHVSHRPRMRQDQDSASGRITAIMVSYAAGAGASSPSEGDWYCSNQRFTGRLERSSA